MLQLFSQCRIWVHLIRIRSSLASQPNHSAIAARGLRHGPARDATASRLAMPGRANRRPTDAARNTYGTCPLSASLSTDAAARPRRKRERQLLRVFLSPCRKPTLMPGHNARPSRLGDVQEPACPTFRLHALAGLGPCLKGASLKKIQIKRIYEPPGASDPEKRPEVRA